VDACHGARSRMNTGDYARRPKRVYLSCE
jgi:hypothetical protein